MAATEIAQRHNGHVKFKPIFGLWSMRPRATFPLLFVIRTCGICGFSATVYDSVVTESLLDMLSLPFALQFITARQDTDGTRCNMRGYSPRDQSLFRTELSFGYATVAGALSSLVYVWFFTLTLNDKIREKNPEEEEEIEQHAHIKDSDVFVARMWRRLFQAKGRRHAGNRDTGQNAGLPGAVQGDSRCAGVGGDC